MIEMQLSVESAINYIKDIYYSVGEPLTQWQIDMIKQLYIRRKYLGKPLEWIMPRGSGKVSNQCSFMYLATMVVNASFDLPIRY